MPKFSDESIRNLNDCSPLLRELFNEVVKIHDCKIVVGYRTKEEQQRLFKEGKTKLQFGKHNVYPSMAVDAYPFPILKEDLEPRTTNEKFRMLKKYYHFSGFVRGIAEKMGIKIRWGGDWDKDFDVNDQDFNDLVHFELV